MVRLEFDPVKTDIKSILKEIQNEGLRISDSSVSALRFLQLTKKTDQQKPQESEHRHEESDDQGHTHGGILGNNTELYFSILCGTYRYNGKETDDDRRETEEKVE